MGGQSYSERIQNWLNAAATAYFAERERRRAALERGEDYRDEQRYDTLKEQFQTLMYLELMTVFGKFSSAELGPIFAACDTAEATCYTGMLRFYEVIDRVNHGASKARQDRIEAILEAYLSILNGVEDFTYDPDLPYANYLNRTASLRLKDFYDKLPIGDRTLLYLDDLKREIKATVTSPTQDELVDLIDARHREAARAPGGEELPRLSKNLIRRYLTGDHGSFTSLDDSLGDAADGTVVADRIADPTASSEADFRLLREASEAVVDQIFDRARELAAAGRRRKAGEDPEERNRFVDFVFLIIRRTYVSGEPNSYRRNLVVKALADEFAISPSAVSQRLKRIDKAFADAIAEMNGDLR